MIPRVVLSKRSGSRVILSKRSGSRVILCERRGSCVILSEGPQGPESKDLTKRHPTSLGITPKKRSE